MDSRTTAESAHPVARVPAAYYPLSTLTSMNAQMIPGGGHVYPQVVGADMYYPPHMMAVRDEYYPAEMLMMQQGQAPVGMYDMPFIRKGYGVGRAPSQRANRQQKPPQSRELYKTEMCRSWQEGRPCPYGDRCLFAHGDTELRPAPRSDKYKTVLCRHYHATGQCQYGSKCRFIHGEEGAAHIGADADMSVSTSVVQADLVPVHGVEHDYEDVAAEAEGADGNTPVRKGRSKSFHTSDKPEETYETEEATSSPLTKSRSHPQLDQLSPLFRPPEHKTPGAGRRAVSTPIMDLSEWKENIAAELAHLDLDK